MLLLQQLQEVSDRRNGRQDRLLVSRLTTLMFDQSAYADSPVAEIGNSLFDEHEGRSVFRVTQALLKAARPDKTAHKISSADWAMVRTLAQGACIILVRKGVGELRADGVVSSSPSPLPPASPSLLE